MDIWGNQSDIDNFLAPDEYSDEETDPGLGLAEGREWTEADGFMEGKGLVRVWVDETGLINKVRISLHWYDKLSDGERLEDSFARCFVLINNRWIFSGNDIGVVSPVKHQDIEIAEPFSPEAHRQIMEEAARLKLKLSKFSASDYGSWQGSPVTGEAADGNVKLYLDELGNLARVSFDDSWLDTARVRMIGDAVIAAHRDARARFRPPTYVPTEADRIKDEFDACRLKLKRMLLNGISLG